MFNFLVIIAFILILFGIYIERISIDNQQVYKKEERTSDEDRFKDLEKRLDEIEEIIFSFENSVTEEKSSNDDEVYFQNTLNDVKEQPIEIQSSDIDDNKFKIIEAFINEEIDLTETCRLLGMNKGEVLLLKNLYLESKN
ncbi:MAG: hypothetical protein H5T96_03205 [Tissierellales bacterium]|nr:hypothetical protein [Tissierellales bacterium]